MEKALQRSSIMLEGYCGMVAKVEALVSLCDGLEAALREGAALKGKAVEAVLQVQLAPTPKAYKEVSGELRMAAEP